MVCLTGASTAKPPETARPRARQREQGRDEMGETRDEDARRNEQRRRQAEELIADELRRRQRARADQALRDSLHPAEPGEHPPESQGDDRE
jgi:hypothetical protein